MQINQDGSVTVPDGEAGTFEDYRLPLVQRLTLLADSLKDTNYAAARLLYEAADRQRGFEAAANERARVMLTQQEFVVSYTRELEGMRRYWSKREQDLLQEIERLQESIERLQEMLKDG